MDGLTWEVWARDLSKLNARFQELDVIRTLEDGFAYVDPAAAPGPLLRMYQDLQLAGYAHGWL